MTRSELCDLFEFFKKFGFTSDEKRDYVINQLPQLVNLTEKVESRVMQMIDDSESDIE